MPLTELKIKTNKPKNLSQDVEEDLLDDEEFELEDLEDDLEEDLEEEDEKDFEEDDSEEDIEEEDEKDPEEADSEEDDLEESEEDDSEDDSEEESQGPRENDRVRSVIEQRNKERDLRIKEHNRRIATEKKMQEMQKSMVENSIKTLKDQKDLLKKQLVQAQTEDDHATAIDIQEKLNEVSVNLMAFESWKPEELTEEPIEIKEDSFESAPQTVKNWAAKNPWFRNPTTPEEKLKQGEAIKYSEELANAGYSLESEEFFKKIDNHLKSKGLASESENKVESKNKDSSKRRKKKKISQTVQSASRTPTSKKNSSKRKVVLNAEQKRIAEVMGITELEYAKSLLEVENAEKTGSRMTTLKF